MKKNTILTLMFCACIVQATWGAEAEQKIPFPNLSFGIEATKERFEITNGHKKRIATIYQVVNSKEDILSAVMHGGKSIPKKDINFAEKIDIIIAIGAQGGIIYNFNGIPGSDDIEEITRRFPYAPLLLISKGTKSYCIDLQPKIPNTNLNHELTSENIERFIATPLIQSTKKKTSET